MVLGSYLLLLVDGIATALLLFCLAAGLTLLFGVFGVFNMAHGTGCLIGAYIAAATFPSGVPGLLGGMAAAIAGGALFGGLLQLLLAPLDGRPMQQSLATLGVAYVTGDLLTEHFGAQPLRVEPPPGRLAGSITVAGQVYPSWRLLFIAVAVLLAAGLFLMISRTRVGAIVRAVAADPAMAASCGINPRTVRWAVFTAAGALTVGIGTLAGPIIGAAPGIDQRLLLQSLIVVVAGGLGSIRGAFIAALGVGLVTEFGALIGSGLAPVLLTLTLVAALALRRPEPGTDSATPLPYPAADAVHADRATGPSS